MTDITLPAPSSYTESVSYVLRSSGPVSAAGSVAVVGITVLGTAAALLAPWLASPAPVAEVLQVLHRMFPFARGLYEDKVANVWCTISVAVKLNRLLPARLVPLACAGSTLAALLPACACCLRPGSRRGPGAFAAALFASSMAFFLLAFQVHEKSILYPCVAATLLPTALGPGRRPEWLPALLCHFNLVCMFSMYPLLAKDRLHVPYAGLCILLAAALEALDAPGALRALFRLSAVGMLALHAVYAAVPPPAKYPDAWTLLITGSSCGCFVLALGAVTLAQLRGSFDGGGLKED